MIIILAFLGTTGIVLCQWLIYYYAPLEVNMGLIQKIFYIHLPLAWWALFSFFMVFIGSIRYLFKGSAPIDNFCKAFAEVGVLLSFLALITGIMWARKSWGVWWTWDPRLSATLIMWFIYSAYLAIDSLDLSIMKKRKIRAVLSIIAFLDVPLVFFSARLFRSIHPAVFGSEGGSLDFEMKLTALACIASFGLIIFSIALLRKKQLDQSAYLKEYWINITN